MLGILGLIQILLSKGFLPERRNPCDGQGSLAWSEDNGGGGEGGPYNACSFTNRRGAPMGRVRREADVPITMGNLG